MGVCVTAQGAVTTKGQQGATYLIFALFAILYGFGIWVGFRYLARPRQCRFLAIYYLLQVPIFTSPWFSYLFMSGLTLSFSGGGSGMGFSYGAGSNFLLSVHQMQPWAIGLNFFAILMAWLSYRGNPVPDLLAPVSLESDDPY